MEEFLTVEEVARILKLSRRTVLRLIYSNKVKATKIGNRWRILRKEIDNLICKQQQVFLPFKETLNSSYDRGKDEANWMSITKEEFNLTYPLDRTCVDLFAGAGGLSLGFKWAGFKTLAAVEIYKEAVMTYAYNFPNVKVINGDIRESSLKEELCAYVNRRLKEMGKEELDVLIGGPPCQGFSLAGFRLVEDPRNNLYREFLDIARRLRPKVLVMENVEGLRSFLGGRVERKIVEDMKNLGYEVSVTTLNSAWYGVPQFRKRVIFIANRLGIKNFYPAPVFKEEDYKTVKDAIEDLLNEPENKAINHIFTRHKSEMVERLRKVPQGGNLYPHYTDAWKRPYWNKPAPTVKENHGGVHIHPLLPRVMTPRELARLQSFPDSFIFKGSKKHQLVQIGNAVPPLMAKAIGIVVRRMLEQDEQKKNCN